MNLSLKIDGIYDLRTLLHLKSIGVRNLSFDFSPKSFSFIQRKVFLNDIIPHVELGDSLYLKFDHSKDPMIKSILEDIKNQRGHLEKTYIQLEKWDQDDLEYFENKQVYFVLNYFSDSKILFSHKFLHGVILEYKMVYDLYIKNVFFNFVTNLLMQLKTSPNSELSLILNSDWDDELFASIVESLDFDLYSRAINGQVEVCYRNVDLKKIANEIHFFTNS